jgi:hypothetical protein
MSNIQVLVILVVVADAACLLLLLRRVLSQRRDSRKGRSVATADPSVDDMAQRLRIFEDTPEGDSVWKHKLESVRDDDVRPSDEEYRVHASRDTPGPVWNPYDEGQSRSARARSVRQRAKAGTRVEYEGSKLAQARAAQTHYQVLGVLPDATQEQIEQAYRRYVADIHPDKFFDDPVKRRGAEKRLRELNSIMQVLRDPDSRADYDMGL